MGLAIAISMSFARSIRSGFGHVVTAAKELADGKLDHEIPVLGRNEFGEVSKALEVFRENSLERRKMRAKDVKDREQRAEAGQLTERRLAHHPGEEFLKLHGT